jgi:hypothetical protein
MPAATGTPARRTKGTLLVLHLSRPVAGIGHFVDHASNVAAHLAQLRAGTGPDLIRAAVEAGVDLELAPRSCPICRAVTDGSAR